MKLESKSNKKGIKIVIKPIVYKTHFKDDGELKIVIFSGILAFFFYYFAFVSKQILQLFYSWVLLDKSFRFFFLLDLVEKISYLHPNKYYFVRFYNV